MFILNQKSFNELKSKLNISKDIDIIGIRGAKANTYCVISDELIIEKQEIDYKTMKCLFIVKIDNSFIAFHGSTVPNIRYVKESIEKNGNGTNQLEYGFYEAYSKGKHSIGKASEHDALRQTRLQPVRRTKDDSDYDFEDRIEIANVHDNIHASWCKLDSEYFESQGCQVIQGYPKSPKRKQDSGDWKTFHSTIYSMDKNTFNYLLMPYKWLNLKNDIMIFGSCSEKVKIIQKFFNLSKDGKYGKDTYSAVLNFQKKVNIDVDGIIGQQTLGKML